MTLLPGDAPTSCDERMLGYGQGATRAARWRIRWELFTNGWTIAVALLITWMLAGSGGCTFSRGKPSLTANDPALVVPALKTAGKGKDKSDLVPLVAALSDDDAGIRMLASEALEHRTGETFGYVYYQDFIERKPSVARWNQWLLDQGLQPVAGIDASTTMPATAPSTTSPSPMATAVQEIKP